ncbi:hypothetical protein [Ascidiimonas sp. W6]|uniref:hypothetical protein n=1 Tax=Ascidiimonas meishanensis TaxID=3128903 RepID=UPI0030ED562D
MKKRSLKNLSLKKKTIAKIQDSFEILGGRALMETFPEYSCHPESCNIQIEEK